MSALSARASRLSTYKKGVRESEGGRVDHCHVIRAIVVLRGCGFMVTPPTVHLTVTLRAARWLPSSALSDVVRPFRSDLKTDFRIAGRCARRTTSVGPPCGRARVLSRDGALCDQNINTHLRARPPEAAARAACVTTWLGERALAPSLNV